MREIVLHSKKEPHIKLIITNHLESTEMSHRGSGQILPFVMAGAIGSIVFGYIMGVLNTSFPYIAAINKWNEEETTFFKSFVNGVVPCGAALGAILSGAFTSTFGRRGSFLLIDLLTIAGTELFPTILF